MANISVGGWSPKPHKVRYQDKPKDIPEWLYQQAKAAKRNYNENWDFWVYETSKQYGVTIEQAELACLKGISKELDTIRRTHGSKLGAWFESYLEMGNIFQKALKLTRSK